MSTTAIQTQLGYAAQASPLAAAYSVAATPIVEKVINPAQQDTGYQEPRNQDPRPDATKEQRAKAPSPPQSAAPENQERETQSGKTQTSGTQARTIWRTELDWRTSEVVYRGIDSRNGEVVTQLPDEALLRLRAYAKQAQTQNEFEPMNVPSLSRDT